MGSRNTNNEGQVKKNADPADSATRDVVPAWLLLTLVAGAILTTCFFIPANTTQLTEESPLNRVAFCVEGAIERYGRHTGSMHPFPARHVDVFRFYFEMIGACVVPYFLAACMSVAAWKRLRCCQGNATPADGLVTFALVLGTLVLLMRWILHAALMVMYSGSPWSLRMGPYIWWFWAIATVVLLVYLMRSWRFAERRYFYHAFAAMTIMTIWFAANLSIRQTTVGTCLSLIACATLLLATVAGFRQTEHLTWRASIRLLALCRLLSDNVVCPGCDYNLYGLTEQRCPECGRGFTFEELGVSPEELGFAGGADDRASP